MQQTNFEPVKVNGVVIDENLLAKEIQYYPAASLEEARIEAAKELALKELLKQVAVARGLGESDEAIDELLAQEIKVSEPTDEECQAYYVEHEKTFVSESLFAASHILLAAAAHELEKREQLTNKAQELITQLKDSPMLFADLAKLFSECSSKEQGGQLGQITKGTIVPEFEAAIVAAPIGLIEEPVETEFGIHIIRVDHREDGRPLPYEYVKNRIQEHLMARKWHKSVNQYLHSLVAQAHIEGVILA
jgi:peptidyl-prolyl cis-trans isomerase C